MSVIEMHSSWLAINTVVGCPNGCKYCLLQANNNNICLPKELVSPKDAVKELLNSKYYDESIPVCLLPNTDAFVNKKNIKYLSELLDEIMINHLPNIIVIITKCKITNDIIEKVVDMQKKGYKIVFYISYSGLGKEIEPNIQEKILKNNFKILHKNGIKVIHYFRPFMPQNSDPKKIRKILNFVHHYTNISVISGLSLIETFYEKIHCWDEVKENKELALKASCIYPNKAWDFFYNNYSHPQLIFQTNTCALNYLFQQSSPYYNTFECKQYNHCTKSQKEICQQLHLKINEKLIVKKCVQLLKRLEIYDDSVEFIFHDKSSLELKNVNAKIGDLSFLSWMLGIKVYVNRKTYAKETYNSSLNGARPLILKVGESK